MNARRARLVPFALSALLSVSLAAGARAQPAVMPAELEGVDVREQLDRSLPKDAVFRDHTGKRVRLGDYFDGKRPVVLTLAYANCKVVCSMVLGAEVTALKEQTWTLGQEYRAVTISIDPRETPEIAAKKRRQMLALYGRAEAREQNAGAHDWDFLVGDEANIKRVADAVGFRYRYDARQDQYAHPAVLMIAKPGGALARYLYGLEFEPNDVRLGLLEAAQGRSISTVEKMILYCYMYDPIGAKYVVVAQNVMRLGGAITVVLLGGFLLVMWARELRTRRKRVSA
ncbi:MAG TPA: SCO family protein, partial [Polyangiaceae bacterium]|nr:SCO family protein [Polyangiaceae bacterium]